MPTSQTNTAHTPPFVDPHIPWIHGAVMRKKELNRYSGRAFWREEPRCETRRRSDAFLFSGSLVRQSRAETFCPLASLKVINEKELKKRHDESA